MMQKRNRHLERALTLFIGLFSAALTVSLTGATEAASATSILPLQVSTSPANGDLNPYGLAVVPSGFPKGTVKAGQLLVSNFNDSSNIQGKGTTIVSIDPSNGQTVLFFQGKPGTPIGFTNALTVAKAGFIFAGSVPTTDPGGTMAAPGPLLVLDNHANVAAQLMLADKINGPWGMALNDQGNTAQLFVSNVLDGTITRLNVSFKHGMFGMIGAPVTIAHGYAFGPDATAVVVGPAGLAYDSKKDVLYVASELDNEIFALAGAGKTTSDLGKGSVVFDDSSHLRGPLGLILATNGDLITANADPSSVTTSTAGTSEIVEFARNGQFGSTFSIDSASGSAFAINQSVKAGVRQFSYVDDAESTLTILRLPK